MKITSGNGVFGDVTTTELRPILSLKFPYHIPDQLTTTTTSGTGTVDQNDARLRLQTSAAGSSKGQLRSKQVIVYQPGQGVVVRFTAAFTRGVAGSEQFAGIGDDDNGFFIGYNGADFGIMRRHEQNDSWTLQSAWTGAAHREQRNRGEAGKFGQVNFPFDPTKGNVYEIKFQWLGFGQITFSIENPETGEFEDIHHIEYGNTSTDVSVHNPSFPLHASVENTSNTTNLTMIVGSMAAFKEGATPGALARFAVDSLKTGVSTETNIITIRSKTTFNSITNHSRTINELLSVAVDGTKIVKIRVYLNATLGGSPSYTDINTTQSTIEYDTAGTTVSNGTLLLQTTLPKTGGVVFTELDSLVLDAGDSLTISAESSASTEVDVALSWRELV